jgi:hypothetical protein
MGGACSMHNGVQHACKILDGEPEGKRPLGKPKQRCEGNIRLNLRYRGREDVYWLIWLRIGTSGEPCEHCKAGNFLTN